MRGVLPRRLGGKVRTTGSQQMMKPQHCWGGQGREGAIGIEGGDDGRSRVSWEVAGGGGAEMDRKTHWEGGGRWGGGGVGMGRGRMLRTGEGTIIHKVVVMYRWRQGVLTWHYGLAKGYTI